MENGKVIHKRPFIVTVEGVGRVLVLKYVRMCDVTEAKCEGSRASCVLKIDPPRSPSCERRPQLPPTPPCPMRSPPGSPLRAPLMQTQMLQGLFETAKNNGEQMVCRRQ
ncbi:DNA-binding phosphoprotein [Pseudocowpox virus]